MPLSTRLSRQFLCKNRLGFVTALIVVILIIILVILGSSSVADLGDDASQNLRSAFNLYATGEYGEFRIGVPGFRREPLPNFVTAFYLENFVKPPRSLSFGSLMTSQKLLDSIVRVNLLWATSLYVLTWTLCRQLFKPSSLANFIAALIIYGSHSSFVIHEVHDLNTELQASVLLVAMACLGLKFYRSQSLWFVLPFGCFGGLLILTKASGVYVLGAAYIPLSFLFSRRLQLPRVLGRRLRRFLITFVALCLSTVLVFAPWSLRNKAEFNQLAISRGDGRVLLIRSEFNKMNHSQYFGSFYAYAPSFLREVFFEYLLGYRQSQLDCGGDLQALNRNLPCDRQDLRDGKYEKIRSFYQRGKRALPAILSKKYSSAGQEFDNDQTGKKLALQSFLDFPLKHLLVTVPFAWRGLWPFEGGLFEVTVAFVCMISLVVILPLSSLIGWPEEWSIVSIVPAGYFWFYAFLSHFRTRYSEPFIPLAFLAGFIMLIMFIDYLKSCSSRKGFLSATRNSKV